MLDLPLLDYAKYAQGTVIERLAFSNDLVASFKDHGFVRICNHGISDEQMDKLFEWSERFFKLPLKAKQDLEMKLSPNPQRGYLTCGVEKTSLLMDLHKDVKHIQNVEEGAILEDERESFTMGPPEDSEFPNIWPPTSLLPGFQDFAEKHFQACRALSLHLIEATAMGLDISARMLLDRCTPDRSDARFNYYPQSSVAALRSGTSARIWPHTDFGILTLLFQDDVGGLELEDRQQGRVFAPVATTHGPGGERILVVNTGDCLQRWTNNRIRAGLHQVSTPPNIDRFVDGVVPARISCPFFLEANYAKSVGPLPPFVSDDCPALYDEITSIEYHRRRVEKEYATSVMHGVGQ